MYESYDDLQSGCAWDLASEAECSAPTCGEMCKVPIKNSLQYVCDMFLAVAIPKSFGWYYCRGTRISYLPGKHRWL